MIRPIFYLILLNTLGLLVPPLAGRASAGTDYFMLCLDDRATARLLVEACTFAYQNKDLPEGDRGLALARRASGLMQLKQVDGAMNDIDLAHRLAPENPEVLRILAKLHNSGMGQPERAVAALNETISEGGTDPKLLFERGMAFYRLGDFERALKDFAQIITIDGQHVEAHRMKGQALTSMMRNEESVLAISEALRLQPGDTWLHMERAGPALASGQFEMARDDLNIALASDLKQAPIWRVRAAANYALGDFAAAGADFTHDIKLEPTSTALTVWRFLADHRDGKATLDDAAKLATAIKGAWPSAVLAYFGKTGSPEAAFDEADAIPELAEVRRSQLLFFLGEWEILTDGSSDIARKHFSAVADGGVKAGNAVVQALGQPYAINDNNILEFALAKARLKELAP